MTYQVQTIYGTETYESLAEAKMFARSAAALTGKATTLSKVEAVEQSAGPDMTDHDN